MTFFYKLLRYDLVQLSAMLKRTSRLFYVSSSGFTLIELLVVIAIIGVLASIVLTSLTGARAKSRDAKRISDLGQIQNALELYNSTNGGYPLSGANTLVSEIAGLAPTYIRALPNDPTRTGSNNYRYCANSSSFVLLEMPEKTNQWCSMTTAPGTACAGWLTSYPSCK